MKRTERHAQILKLLTGLKKGVTVRWIAKQMRMTGQRALICKDVRDLEREGKVAIEGVLDAVNDMVGNCLRNRSQKILVIQLKEKP